jgi:predicted dehydrogenase
MNSFTRRTLLTTAAGIAISAETACTSKANSRVTFGVIGVGRRGSYVGAFMASNPNAQLVAICDVYDDRIAAGRAAIPGADKVHAYKDLHEMLVRPDIDAVLIATPVFLHPAHFEAAVKSKKHVYCEKPCAASVAGVKQMIAAARTADPTKTIQFGFQQRYSPEYLHAKSLVDQGRIGEVKLMMSYWILANMLGGPIGPFAHKLPPDEEMIRRWEFYRETSGGPIVEQDCHGVDAMNWFAGNHPLKAVGTGGLRYPLPYGDWTSDHHNITYYYPGDIEGHLTSVKERHIVAYRDVREMFVGSDGVIETARTYYKIFGIGPKSAAPNADDLRDRSLVEQRDSKREITIDAVAAFFRSIVDTKQVNDTREATESTLTSLLGRMAYETKREVTWEELLASEPDAVNASQPSAGHSAG